MSIMSIATSFKTYLSVASQYCDVRYNLFKGIMSITLSFMTYENYEYCAELYDLFISIISIAMSFVTYLWA